MKKPSLTLHPTVTSQLSSLRRSMPQSILLIGPRGVGLHTIARDIAGSDLIYDITPLDRKGEVSATASISIERIRELYELTRGKSTTRRIVIIDDADQMTESAQNALLKLLEEPTPHVHFILTSHVPHRLLSTVLSRVAQYQIVPISAAQTDSFIQQLGVRDDATGAQLRFVASGLPAEMSRLATDSRRLAELRTIMGDAREFLASRAYDRLRIAIRYQVSRDQSLALIDAIQRLLSHTIANDPSTRHLELLDRSLDIHDQIVANRNTKLQLLRLVA